MQKLFTAALMLLLTNCSFGQLGGGGGVSGKLWDNWINDAYLYENVLDGTKVTFSSVATWDLDPGAGVTQTVNLSMGNEVDSKEFTGPDSGNLKAENLDPGEPVGSKTSTLYIGTGMEIGLLDSLTVELPDANEIHFSRAVGRLWGLGPNYTIKYRHIVENNDFGFKKFKFRVKDDMGNWQTLETKSLIIGKGNTKASSYIKSNINKDWKKTHWLGFDYFDIRVELWDTTLTTQIDWDEGIALVE